MRKNFAKEFRELLIKTRLLFFVYVVWLNVLMRSKLELSEKGQIKIRSAQGTNSKDIVYVLHRIKMVKIL